MTRARITTSELLGLTTFVMICMVFAVLTLCAVQATKAPLMQVPKPDNTPESPINIAFNKREKSSRHSPFENVHVKTIGFELEDKRSIEEILNEVLGEDNWNAGFHDVKKPFLEEKPHIQTKDKHGRWTQVLHEEL